MFTEAHFCTFSLHSSHVSQAGRGHCAHLTEKENGPERRGFQVEGKFRLEPCLLPLSATAPLTWAEDCCAPGTWLRVPQAMHCSIPKLFFEVVVL